MIEDDIFKGNLFCLANVDAKKVLDSLEDETISQEIGRKRKRLDDFTPQEKMVRRKLKNRVAAQNARDRKKERLEQLENVVSRLERENKELKKSNEELRSNMTLLMSQNKEMRKRLGMDSIEETDIKLSETPIITPTVMDHDHIVIKKEEVLEPEYAAESSGTSCLINHDVVSQSQVGQLLELLEQFGAGNSGQITSTKKVVDSQEKEQQQKDKINRTAIATELDSHNSELSGEDASELFSLCKEIQDLVDGPNNDIGDVDLQFLSKVVIQDEVISPSEKKLTNKEVDIDIMELLDYPVDKISPNENDSGFSSDDDSSFSFKSNDEDDFLDLFPMLSSV